MRKIIFPVAIASFILSANADGPTKKTINDTYFGVNLAHSFKNNARGLDKKNGHKSEVPNFDISAGRIVNDHYHVELAAGYRKFKYNASYRSGVRDYNDTQKLTAYRLMVNNYLDIAPIYKNFTPYVMVGLGVTHIKPGIFHQRISGLSDVGLKNKKTTNFSYQLGLGVDINLTEQASLDIGVRHIDYGKLKSADAAAPKYRLKSNEATVGIKFNF